MKRTTTEVVTRIYCDVCAKDITNNNIETDDPTAKYQYQVCAGEAYYFESANSSRLTFGCENLAKLYTDFPDLANDNFQELIEASELASIYIDFSQ